MKYPTLRRRAGFTLLEVVLVLAIIVVLGAIAAPLFQGTLRVERLRKGVELVAADWVATRAKAMETGQTQVWVCEVGGASYSSSTYSNTSGLSSSEASSIVTATTGLSATDQSASGSGDFGKVMPSGVSISEVLVSEGDSIMTMAETTGAAASTVVFFYSNGTSSSARLTVMDDQQRTMTVVLNGLSGRVRVPNKIGGVNQ